jgi:hypothetical protein
MPSSLTAGNATNSGVSLTGAVDGALEIKTGSGAGTTAVTVSTGQIVTLANALPIASGGTGGTTAVTAFDALSPATTKGDLIVSNGTDNVRQAVGTNDYVLTADSTTATGIKWAAAGAGGSGGFSAMQTFASSGTFTVPAGKTTVKVTVIGGGGGGTQGASYPSGGEPGYTINEYGAGGGSGGAAIEYITGLTPGGTVTVTIGAAGAAGGGTGGTSSFGAYCSATGAAANVGGSGSGGNINMGGASAGGGGRFSGPSSGFSILGSYGSGGGAGNGGGGAGAGVAGVVTVEY